MESYKVYNQDLGNISLDIFNNRIEMYVEKGYIRKSKNLAKVIYFSEIEKLETKNNELIVKLINGEVEKIIFKRKELARKIYEALVGFIPKSIINRSEENSVLVFKGIIENTLYFIHLLFDLILDLKDRINWEKLEEDLKDVQEVYNKIKSNYSKFVDLEFTKIEKNFIDRDPEQILFEVYNILRQTVSFYRGLSKVDDKDVIIFKYKFPDFVTVIESDVLLNDIILGIILGDKYIDKEIGLLIDAINSISRKRDEINYIISEFQELKFRGKDDQKISEIRSLFKDLVMRYLSSNGSKVSLS